MNSVLVLIPLSLLFLIMAGILFFWASNHGQFDDMDSPALLPMSDNLPDEEEADAPAHDQLGSYDDQDTHNDQDTHDNLSANDKHDADDN